MDKEIISIGQVFLVKDFGGDPTQGVAALVDSVRTIDDHQEAKIKTSSGQATFQVSTAIRVGRHTYMDPTGQYLYRNVTSELAERSKKE